VRVDFERPELRFDFDETFHVRARSSPIFFAGRYRKLSREIPATLWIHHACRGQGCNTCSYSGTLCGPSLQEILERPLLRHSGGTTTSLHTLGREDTDVLMLGEGRPFVVEVSRPRKRTLPLRHIQEVVAASGLVEISRLTPVEGSMVAAVKKASADKTYRAWIVAERPLPADAAARVETLRGVTLQQLSPTRVMHRRGRDTLRKKRFIQSIWLGEIHGRYVWEMRVESGTYIKELVSGDEGRTRPSLSEALGVPCRVVALDVLQVHWDPPWNRQEMLQRHDDTSSYLETPPERFS